MANYIVDFTDISTSPNQIEIEEGGIDTTSVDVALFGRIRLEYGELLNENLLHLLENFSCEEDPFNVGNPDTSKTLNNLLVNPTLGQLWYNSTQGVLYYWEGQYWIPISEAGDVAANWGTIYHGQQLPKPVSAITGYEFDYPECIWSVAPASYVTSIRAMNCATDSEARVTMQIKVDDAGDITVDSFVNYLIIGIRGNNNLGVQIPPPPLPGVSPTPTPTPTQTIGLTVTPTVTPTGTPPVSPPISPTPSNTPEPVAPLDGRLYISPSLGDSGQPGPSTGNTYYVDTTGNITKAAYDQSTYFSLQSISGGVPPYTVDFSNITAVIQPDGGDPSGLVTLDDTVTSIWEYGSAYPDSTMINTYYGGSEANTNPIRTGITSASLPYIRMRLDSAQFYSAHDYKMKIRFNGRVILSDSVGNTKQWWIPESCPVGGTNLTQPGNDGPFGDGTTVYYYANWDHTGIEEVQSSDCSLMYAEEGPKSPAGEIFTRAARVAGYNVYNDNYGSMSRTALKYGTLQACIHVKEDSPGTSDLWLVIIEASDLTTQQELYDYYTNTNVGWYNNVAQATTDPNVECRNSYLTSTLLNPTVSKLGNDHVQLVFNSGSNPDIDRWIEASQTLTCRTPTQICWGADLDNYDPAPPDVEFTFTLTVTQSNGTTTSKSVTQVVSGIPDTIKFAGITVDYADGGITQVSCTTPSGVSVKRYYSSFAQYKHPTDPLASNVVDATYRSSTTGSWSLSPTYSWQGLLYQLVRTTIYVSFE